AQHQRVHKKSDQTLYLLPVPVRVGSPHHDDLLPAVAAQHHLQPRQQCHEQRHPLLPAQPLQPPAQLLTHPDRLPRPRITLHRRTAPLRRQLQLRRRPPQLLPPILELLLQHLPPQPVPLPHRIVGILHRQFRQWRGLLLAIRLIQLHKLPPQHLHRPPIRHDVVHHIQHHLLPRPHLHQLHPQQRPAPQIKGPPRLRRRQLPYPPLPLPAFQPPQGNHFQPDRALLPNHLHRPPPPQLKARAQHLVPPHYLGHHPLQRRHVQRTFDPHRTRYVIGSVAGLQLVQKPQPLLRIRERQLAPPFHPHQGGRLQPPARRPQLLHFPGQLPHARASQGAPQLHPQALPHPRHQPRGQQRMAPQLEKIVAHPHPPHPQHFLIQPRQYLLHRRARGHVPLHRPPRTLRRGQTPAVHPPVGRQGQSLQPHHKRRHHVLRQPFLEIGPEFLRPAALLHHHIPHQLLLPPVSLPRHHHALPHSRMPAPARLYLPQLDPIPPPLHLLVLAADKLQVPVRQIPAQVPAPVEPLPGLPAPRIGHKPLGRQLRPVHIPPRQPRPANIQLPAHPHRHRPPVPVQHIHPRVRDR